MKQKGFTFIEMLGVVVLLALLVMVVYPTVINRIKETEDELSEAEKQILYTSTYSYIADNNDNYPIRAGNVFCITLSSLDEAGMIPVTLKHVDTTAKIKVTISDTKDLAYSVLASTDTCTEVKNK